MSRSAKSSLSTIQIQSGKLTLNPLVCMSTPNVCCKHPFLWPQKTCSPPSPINGFRLHSFAKCRQGLIRVQPSGEAASHHNMKTSWVQFQVLRDKKTKCLDHPKAKWALFKPPLSILVGWWGFPSWIMIIRDILVSKILYNHQPSGVLSIV
jgi:hypothetical protein